ncbi:hypothetical protein A9P82_06520 [Arachidicoccus ginsenosidimutans]|uniref:FecR family protein n=1 Tax=Arachidicoccus sp. BS20 TaxID=1850526 RepID=UPI0007F0603E|nr:FecR family protein [Arachidicoccus sp. BS20]ANI88978.1 hypothetical protein A9P82_06520 [Arachidicoccus sp. BS20]
MANNNFDKDYYRALADKWVRGIISDAELGELEAWYNDHGAYPVELPPGFAAGKQQLADTMLDNIEAKTGTVHISVGNKKKFQFYRWAAAAVLVIGLGIGLKYYFFKNNTDERQSLIVYKDVPPGHDGAVLTLADGSKVVLDSTSMGRKQVAQQGSVRIVSVNGQLSYNGTNAGVVKPAYNTLATPRARQYKIVLPDGTKVWLNAASSITYPVAFTGNTREVSVTGETYFEVVHDAAKPFRVNVRGQAIEDIGTHFDISAYDDEPVVKSTLLEGAVRVVKGAQSVILQPGQQAIVGNSNANIQVEKVKTDDIVAWTRGFLLMNNNSVREFMNRLSRWYNVDVQFEGNMPEGNFGGMLNSNANLSDILSALDAGGIHTRFDGKTVTVLSH